MSCAKYTSFYIIHYGCDLLVDTIGADQNVKAFLELLMTHNFILKHNFHMACVIRGI